LQVKNKGTIRTLAPEELAAFARSVREKAGVTQAEAGRTLGVSRSAIFNAENKPEKSFSLLRKRIIEEYSGYGVIGPEYRIVERDRRF